MNEIQKKLLRYAAEWGKETPYLCLRYAFRFDEMFNWWCCQLTICNEEIRTNPFTLPPQTGSGYSKIPGNMKVHLQWEYEKLRTIEQFDKDDYHFLDKEFLSVIDQVSAVYGMYKKSCRCKALDSLKFGNGTGWVLDCVKVYWCPECGKKLLTLNDLETESNRFSRLGDIWNTNMN